MSAKPERGYDRQDVADLRRQPRLRSIVAIWATVIAAYAAFTGIYGFGKLKLLASALTRSDADCTFLRAPTVTLQATDSVRISWTTACKLDAAHVTYTLARDPTNARLKKHNVLALPTRVGPLDSWAEYAADIHIEQGQCIEYTVATGNSVLDMLPAAEYCHRLAHAPQQDSDSSFTMAVADLGAISANRDLQWARQLRQQLALDKLDFIVDTAPAASMHSGVLEQVPRTRASRSPPFATWIGDVCIVFATTIDVSQWQDAAATCDDSQKTVVVLEVSRSQLLEYRLGASGWWRSRRYMDYVAAVKQLNVKTVVLRTQSRLHSVDIMSDHSCSSSQDCQPNTAAPLCGWVAQSLDVCSLVSSVTFKAVPGQTMTMEIRSIDTDSARQTNKDAHNVDAELLTTTLIEL